MDELSILRARVTILERRLGQANVEMQKLIEAFEEFRRYSRPFIPLPEEPRTEGDLILEQDMTYEDWR